jgi:hypothetical protein
VSLRCDDLVERLIALAREGPGAALDAELAEHVERCAPCAARVELERALASRLRRLRLADEGHSAPEALQLRLIDAYRRSCLPGVGSERALGAAAPAAPRSRRALSWPLAAAAVLALASALPLLWRAARPASDEATPSIDPVHWAKGSRGFVRLPAADVLGGPEALSIVRVRMPGSAAARIGVSLGGAPDEGSLEADLMVGQDGMARAIRIVAWSETNVADGGGR